MPAITIKSIRLENYCQFRSAIIDLNPSKDRNIAVIEGPGGSGKSTILRAAEWCLFGPERHPILTPGPYGLCNATVYKRLKTNTNAMVSVEIALSTPKGEIKFSRSIKVCKPLSGTGRLDKRSMLFTASRHTQAGWRKLQDPGKEVAAIFPPMMRHLSFIRIQDLHLLLHAYSSARPGSDGSRKSMNLLPIGEEICSLYEAFALSRRNARAELPLSIGEEICLGYKTIAAVRKNAGAKVPLVIDSPFQMLSSDSQGFIANLLKKEFNDVQVILLVNRGEISKAIASVLSQRIGAKLEIVSSIDSGVSGIKPRRDR